MPPDLLPYAGGPGGATFTPTAPSRKHHNCINIVHYSISTGRRHGRPKPGAGVGRDYDLWEGTRRGGFEREGVKGERLVLLSGRRGVNGGGCL